MRPRLELVGKKFGRLTVVSKNPVSTSSNNSRWDCICDCGKTTVVTGSKLINGHTSSCGCYQYEQFVSSSITHGMHDTPEYGVWCGIKARCLNQNNEAYNRYGGRGISIHPSWVNSFETFYMDVGPRPSPQHSIDRLDNDLGYEPDNCVWVTDIEQANNRRTNTYYEHQGESKTIAQWARQYNVAYSKLYKRLKLGWEFELAVKTP